MSRFPLLLLAILACLVFPRSAWADAGTPLMWAGMLHLVFGNILIGVGEGLLLARLFSIPKRKSILVMIPANYVSAWGGGLFLRGAIVDSLSISLTNARKWFWVMVVVTYVITLIMEWPFIALCLRGAKDWLRRSLRASLIVQSASYVLLFGWYWMASADSIYTRMNIVEPAGLSLPKSVLVYFISAADGNVYKRLLAGGSEEKVYDLHSMDENDRLFIRPNVSEAKRWDLAARLDGKNHREQPFVDVLTGLRVEAAPDVRGAIMNPPRINGTWLNFGPAASLGSAANSSWEFQSCSWAGEGLMATNHVTGKIIQFSYETPFGAWTVRNAVHLPSDKVLFQLGDDQICAFDPETRQVALLWRGRGPVPVIEIGGGEQNNAANESPLIRKETNRAPATGCKESKLEQPYLAD